MTNTTKRTKIEKLAKQFSTSWADHAWDIKNGFYRLGTEVKRKEVSGSHLDDNREWEDVSSHVTSVETITVKVPISEIKVERPMALANEYERLKQALKEEGITIEDLNGCNSPAAEYLIFVIENGEESASNTPVKKLEGFDILICRETGKVDNWGSPEMEYKHDVSLDDTLTLKKDGWKVGKVYFSGYPEFRFDELCSGEIRLLDPFGKEMKIEDTFNKAGKYLEEIKTKINNGELDKN